MKNNEILSESIETNNESFITEYTIDCLEINEELVKISPLLKTLITPQEIFTRIVPRIFDCFDSYWKIRKFLSKIAFKFLPKNKRQIKELLDLKFSNDYDVIDNEYRIHKFVNYILVDKLSEQYKNTYFDKDLQKLIKDKQNRRYFEPSLISYAKFMQNSRYNLLSKTNLTANLHNIYYDHLSKRYKKSNFKEAEKLFNIKFYINDARKSILKLNKHYDLIFLDAFTYSKAPELWTIEFMAELYKRLSPTGILMTYSNSALVRNTLLENNFYVGKIYCNKTKKYIGTIAAKEKNLIEHPLTNFEIGLCNTKAGIPFRDPLLNYDKEIIKDLVEILTQSSIEVCEGQAFDMEFETRNDVKIEEYINMIRLKTGVLLSCALRLGAVTAHCSKENLELLNEFALNIGIAFQIQDDILDCWSDVEVFGKITGKDIIDNKKTFLYLKALEIGNQRQQNILQELYSSKNFEPAQKEQVVKSIYEDLKIKELAEKEMLHYHNLAIQSLEKIDIDNQRKENLRRFSEKLINRNK